MIHKTWVLSDVHGHHDELMALYKKLPINPKEDRLIMLGDMIDRGPDSRKVIEQCMKWKKRYPHWQFLYGNHCDLMLDALLYNGRIYGSFDLWYQQGGKETFLSYIPKNLTPYEKSIIQVKEAIPQDHLLWLASLPRYFEDENYIYVHAGLKPGKTAEETDPYDLIWIRDEFIDSDYDWGKKVIFGHTPSPTLEPWVMKNKIGIDTAVCYSANNKLTAIELPAEKFYFQENLLK